MRSNVVQAMAALLLLFAAGCASDATIPSLPAQDGLWTASAGPSAILRLDPTELSDTGERDPATTVTTSSARLFTLIGVAFDAEGRLWVASQDDSSVLAFAPGALSSSGSKAATTVISSIHGSLSGPTGLAFDSQHRLWVIDNGTGTLDRYDPAQLALGGAQTPAVTLRMPGDPSAIAFDADGSLWVSDHQFHIVFKFTAAQLDSGGSLAPVIELRDSVSSLVNPAGLAFDAAGNLWVANSGGGTLVAYSPAQLVVGGAPAPHVVITSNGGSLDIPLGLAFDGDGSLWVVGGGGALTKFAKTSLAARGAPVPAARLQIHGYTLFWSLAFWPKPVGLPLH